MECPICGQQMTKEKEYNSQQETYYCSNSGCQYSKEWWNKNILNRR